MMKTRNRIGIALAALALCAAFAAPAAAGESEIGFQFGVWWPDKDITGVQQDLGDFEPVIGARGGWRFTEKIGMFVDGWYSQPNSISAGSIDTLAGRTGVEFWLGGDSADDKRWFLDLGAGVKDFSVDGAPDPEVTFASVGLGQRIRFRDRNFFRWEARSDHSIDDDDLPPGADLWNPQLNFAIGTIFGGERTDSDGDGVLDRKDKCPNTPRGALVDERGCPTDADGDGVFDGLDKCPDTPAGYPVDADGCPKDSDGDGVVDGEDDCPDTPRGAIVDANGCPKDSDGDNVYDGLDKCPNTPKGARVGPDGCPMDSDGDKVWDGLDKCPNTPRGAVVDADGCPKDSDGDGVYDGLDKCPGTPAGTVVAADGCPEKRLFTEERKTFVLEGVNFATDSARLTENSKTILDGVAATLQEWPKVTVEVGGHTDSRGSDSYNQQLSERRAKSVMDYLVSKGIDARRMTSKGYGESKPVADNETKEGRAKNRRVELKQTN